MKNLGHDWAGHLVCHSFLSQSLRNVIFDGHFPKRRFYGNKGNVLTEHHNWRTGNFRITKQKKTSNVWVSTVALLAVEQKWKRNHPGLNFCFGVTFDKEENFMHEIVLVFGWDATEFYIFAAKLLYQRFFPQGLQETHRQI